MRRRPFAATLALALGLITALVTATLAGCASHDKSDADAAGQDAVDAFQDEPGDDEDVSTATQAHADRLDAALARSSGGRVDWSVPDGSASRRRTAADQADDADAGAEPSPTLAQVLAQWVERMPAPTAATDATDDADALSRRELFERLLHDLRRDEGEPMSRALVGVLLSVADSGRELDPQLLAGLDPGQQHTVRQYHHVMQLMRRELSQGDDALAREAIERQLIEMFGEQPISIRLLELCRQVSGYGNYEPFESQRFLAGKPQKMIVYVELDNFHVHQLDNGRHQVKLEQEVVLYNEADGLAVWRHDPVQILDTSRNRRRDFFVVQLITLPARVSVGQYRLKVRITDMNGGSIDETTTRLEFVADEDLLRAGDAAEE